MDELNQITQGANISDVKPKPRKTTLSPIQKRLLKHFAQGKSLSIKNMYEVKISNPSREIGRGIRDPFGIFLNVKRIDWKDEFSNGYYFEYAPSLADLPKIHQLCKDNDINF